MTWTRLDFDPKEPLIPRSALKKKAPGELQAMNLLGPLAKGMALLVGKQEPDKKLPRGGLGVLLEESAGTVKISQVLDNSPASKAGIRPGDVITKIQGDSSKRPARPVIAKITTIANALSAMDDVRPGDKVRLSLVRDKENIDIIVIAGEGF